MDKETNKTNIKLLNDLFNNPDEKIAIFIGAGLSEPLGIKGWKEALTILGNKVALDESYIKSYLSVYGETLTASMIYKKIGNHNTYLSYMNKLFTQHKIGYGQLHKIILDNFGTVLSTNFDDSLERYCNDEGKKYTTQRLPYFNPFTLLNNLCIVYLHGNREDDVYIFRDEEFKDYYPSVSDIKKGNTVSYELENFLDNTFKFFNTIFIGFSFNDEYLTKFIQNTFEKWKYEKEIFKKNYYKDHPLLEKQYYAFLHENNNKISRINKLGINTITYGNDDLTGEPEYIEIVNYLKQITINKSIEESSTKPISLDS